MSQAMPDPCSVPISEILPSTVIAVRPELTLKELMQTFIADGISAAPVLDAEQRLVGVVSKTDVIRDQQTKDGNGDKRYGLEKEEEVTVGDVMMPLVFALNPTSTIAEAAAVMAFEYVHRAPVVDENEKLIGILSLSDIARWIAESCGYDGSPLEDVVFDL